MGAPIGGPAKKNAEQTDRRATACSGKPKARFPNGNRAFEKIFC
jgi:hypothetical protein